MNDKTNTNNRIQRMVDEYRSRPDFNDGLAELVRRMDEHRRTAVPAVKTRSSGATVSKQHQQQQKQQDNKRSSHQTTECHDDDDDDDDDAIAALCVSREEYERIKAGLLRPPKSNGFRSSVWDDDDNDSSMSSLDADLPIYMTSTTTATTNTTNNDNINNNNNTSIPVPQQHKSEFLLPSCSSRLHSRNCFGGRNRSNRHRRSGSSSLLDGYYPISSSPLAGNSSTTRQETWDSDAADVEHIDIDDIGEKNNSHDFDQQRRRRQQQQQQGDYLFSLSANVTGNCYNGCNIPTFHVDSLDTDVGATTTTTAATTTTTAAGIVRPSDCDNNMTMSSFFRSIMFVFFLYTVIGATMDSLFTIKNMISAMTKQTTMAAPFTFAEHVSLIQNQVTPAHLDEARGLELYELTQELLNQADEEICCHHEDVMCRAKALLLHSMPERLSSFLTRQVERTVEDFVGFVMQHEGLLNESMVVASNDDQDNSPASDVFQWIFDWLSGSPVDDPTSSESTTTPTIFALDTEKYGPQETPQSASDVCPIDDSIVAIVVQALHQVDKNIDDSVNAAWALPLGLLHKTPSAGPRRSAGDAIGATITSALYILSSSPRA